MEEQAERSIEAPYTLAKKVAYMAKFKVAFLLMYTCVASEAIKKWLFKTIMYVDSHQI